MEVVLLFVGVAVIAIAIRLFAGTVDSGRIESYIEDHGGTLLEKSWDPFGPGWFGEKDSRLYKIVYRDAHGDVHEAHVKTSMLSGVYLTNDCVIQRAVQTRVDEGETDDNLRRENERLRKRIEELERSRM
jgi:hypothetical protein